MLLQQYVFIVEFWDLAGERGRPLINALPLLRRPLPLLLLVTQNVVAVVRGE